MIVVRHVTALLVCLGMIVVGKLVLDDAPVTS